MGYKKYSVEFKRDVLAMAAEGTRSVGPQLERDCSVSTADAFLAISRSPLSHSIRPKVSTILYSYSVRMVLTPNNWIELRLDI
jgi:hypothetical protein